MAMKQLTIRGFGPELERTLRTTARAKGISLNKAALDLMRRAAGLDRNAPDTDVIGDALDSFIGTWSKADERQILDAVRAFDVVDEDLWQ